MSVKDWHTRLAYRWERRLVRVSPPAVPGRSIRVDTWQWRLGSYAFMLLLVTAVALFGSLKAALVLAGFLALTQAYGWGWSWWHRRRPASPIGFSTLLVIIQERGAGWMQGGLTWRGGRQGRRTDNPSWFLRLHGPHRHGVLTVWSSGDATVHVGDHGQKHHYSVSSAEDVKACVDDLEAALRRIQ
jgi:hypothetical protein